MAEKFVGTTRFVSLAIVIVAAIGIVDGRVVAAEPATGAGPSIASATAAPASAVNAKAASFAAFDQKATAGGTPMSVVFFGGSLTWGANASDPQRTSYRALMGQYLQRKYPKCPFTFRDAAIGGTGSRLGMFRLQRDVLSSHPDLVFYDFTANDDLFSADPAALASYETILREMIGQGIPVVQAYLGFKFNFGELYAAKGLPRVLAHQKLADAYHTAVGNTFTYVQHKLDQGEAKLDQLWPFDGAHPDDSGYRLFFEAVRDGFEQAVAKRRACTVPPEPVFGFQYHVRSRITLVDHPLPAGWTRASAFRTSLWFDGLPSRWMDDVAVADIAKKSETAPLKLDFVGTSLGIFGEADQDGLGFKVRVDGKFIVYQPKPLDPPSDVWPANTAAFGGGRLFFWRDITSTLTPGKHTLELSPVFPATATKGQLHIESVCVAGE